MKKLQCEICGGSLMMQDGIAVCESCGMKFSKDEVKKMVVELSGPIKIDGEVKVTGVDDADALYRRAKDFVKLGDKDSALKNYTEMTTKYPGDYRGWVGMAELSLPNGVLKKEWSSPNESYFDNEPAYFCPGCGAGPFLSLSDRHDSHPDCKKAERIAKRDIKVSVPLKLDSKEIETRREQSVQHIQEYMAKAFIAADASLRGKLEETQRRFLEKCHEIVDQALAETEKWNQACEDEFAKVRRDLAEKSYWSIANADFMNAFPLQHKDDVLGFLLKLDEKQLRKELKGNWGSKFFHIIYFKYVKGRTVALRYEYSDSGSNRILSTDSFYTLPNSMAIQGDIRPLFDGFTYKKPGLLGSKTVYSYANDPDKDNGPTFDE